jgi:hypothetical protein
VQASHVRSDVLLLVAGFSTNEYLFQRITVGRIHYRIYFSDDLSVLSLQDRFASNIAVIRPADGDLASYGGGARVGIGSLVSSVIPPQNVFRWVTLPAEQEDRTLRPAYITGVPGSLLCENR